MSLDKIYIQQLNTNKMVLIHVPEHNFMGELLEITKKRIARLEGCPEEWINWINKDIPYD
jgi:hypothetical protein